jgi:hypothetical protein
LFFGGAAEHRGEYPTARRAAEKRILMLACFREFAHRVAAVEKLKATQRASLAELDALFASLQHRAFRESYESRTQRSTNRQMNLIRS